LALPPFSYGKGKREGLISFFSPFAEMVGNDFFYKRTYGLLFPCVKVSKGGVKENEQKDAHFETNLSQVRGRGWRVCPFKWRDYGLPARPSGLGR
jgi:hypothetical protein